MNSIDVVITLPDSFFPLAQCTGLEVGEPFGFMAKFDVGDSYCASEETLDMVHNLVNTPLEGCRYECINEESSRLCFNYAFPNSLIIPMFSLRVHNPLFPLSIL